MSFKYLIIGSFIFVLGCKKAALDSSVDIQENAQQVGDVMASVDESSGTSGGNLAGFKTNEINSIEKTFMRYAPAQNSGSALAQIFLPRAEAISCSGYGFDSCSSNAITRNFNGCQIGSATLTGTVQLNWGGSSANCQMTTAGDFVSRNPQFTITGRREATLAVSKVGTVGQRVTWVSGSGANKVFSLTNDGINRKFTLANSQVIFDQTTTVTSAITVTGTSRSSRVMNGGTLRVTNNVNNVVCDYVPSQVTWSTSTCNCPVSGSWGGSCSDGKTTALQITGCGTATYTEGDESENVTFDRCGS